MRQLEGDRRGGAGAGRAARSAGARAGPLPRLGHHPLSPARRHGLPRARSRGALDARAAGRRRHRAALHRAARRLLDGDRVRLRQRQAQQRDLADERRRLEQAATHQQRLDQPVPLVVARREDAGLHLVQGGAIRAVSVVPGHAPWHEADPDPRREVPRRVVAQRRHDRGRGESPGQHRPLHSFE